MFDNGIKGKTNQFLIMGFKAKLINFCEWNWLQRLIFLFLLTLFTYFFPSLKQHRTSFKIYFTIDKRNTYLVDTSKKGLYF